MTSNSNSAVSANDHIHVTDALLRFGAGVDDGDTHLLVTAFTSDAVVDFGPCGQKMGLDFPMMSGGETIVGFLGTTARTQTTSHVVTNARVHVEGNEARLRALVDATHRPKPDPSRHCRMMNWYEVKLVKDQTFWRMRHVVIYNLWFTGESKILMER